MGSIVLGAGGTGGHIFPAEALAVELVRRGHTVNLITDKRGFKHTDCLPYSSTEVVSSATIKRRTPVGIMTAVCSVAMGMWSSYRIIRRVRPSVVVGFGGYPSYPPLKTAQLLSIPTVVHEANAIMGRANRAMANWATKIATSFPVTERLSDALAAKVVCTGNPVRTKVLEASRVLYDRESLDAGTIKLLVCGGSQGSRYFNSLLPETVYLLPEELRSKLKVTHQLGNVETTVVAKSYKQAGVSADVDVFFLDLPFKIADSHLVLCRSGASTVAELSAIGRPAIMIPAPWALDQDQLRNAEIFEATGGGWIAEQGTLSPVKLANMLTRILSDPIKLAKAAFSAIDPSVLDAGKRLADLVEQCGSI